MAEERGSCLIRDVRQDLQRRTIPDSVVDSLAWREDSICRRFAIAEASIADFTDRDCKCDVIAVGGDYTKPNDSTGTAAWSSDGGQHWTASTTPPHGYRSSVQWSGPLKLWITAGTNGSDISRDDGRTWQPLDNGNWNALSLPFVVGPNGRIARLALATSPSFQPLAVRRRQSSSAVPDPSPPRP